MQADSNLNRLLVLKGKSLPLGPTACGPTPSSGDTPQRPEETARLVGRLNPPTRPLPASRADHGSFRLSPAHFPRSGPAGEYRLVPLAGKLPAGSLGRGSRASWSASAYRRPPRGRRCLRGYHGLPVTKRCPRQFARWSGPRFSGSVSPVPFLADFASAVFRHLASCRGNYRSPAFQLDSNSHHRPPVSEIAPPA